MTLLSSGTLLSSKGGTNEMQWTPAVLTASLLLKFQFAITAKLFIMLLLGRNI